MATDTDCQTLAAAIDDLARRGFTESLAVVGHELHTIKTPKTFRPDEVVIREYRRFEGVSDPDDMSIVYAIETEGGIRGTLVDAYGVYSDPAVRAFLSTVPMRRSQVLSRQQGGAMDDAEVLGRINELARDEHELFERESHGKVTDADRERLRRLQVTLDQCWDLLRQRRARRAAGLDPGEARVRDEKTVEGYAD